MEGFGVLRAAALAGVPAVEVRVVSNAIGEPDRARWRFARRSTRSPPSLPALIGGRACLSCRRRCRPASAPSDSSSPRRSAPTATTSGGRCRSASRSRSPTSSRSGTPRACRCSCCWAATPLFVAAFVWACQLVLARGRRARAVVARGADLPPAVPASALFVLPGIAWFAFIGLAVPAAMVEGLRFRDALVRGRQLGVADYVHALGSLAALVIVVGVARRP